jgi:hypothetical protein
MLEGRAIFHVSGDKLEVTTYGLSGKSEFVYPLGDLSPHCTKVSQRKLALAFGLLAISAILGAVIWKGLTSDEPANHFIYKLGLFLAVIFSYSVRAMLPFVHYEFRRQDGQKAFNVFRELHQTKECDAFVSQLSLCIEAAQGGLIPADISGHLRDIETGKKGLPIENKWISALVFGACAALLPLIPGYTDILSGFGALLVIGCTIGGMSLCVLSFLAKERWRWLSLIGAALGMVPPLFY